MRSGDRKAKLKQSIMTAGIAAAAFAAGLAATTGGAGAQEQGWYLGGAVGYEHAQVEFQHRTTKSKDAFSGGGAAAAAFVGYERREIHVFYGVEGEAGLTAASPQGSADGRSLEGGVAFVSRLRGRVGSPSADSADPIQALEPYLAAGASFAAYRFDTEGDDDVEPLFGLNIGAGVQTSLNDRTALRVEYIYDYFFESVVEAGPNSDQQVSLHGVRAGISYRF